MKSNGSKKNTNSKSSAGLTAPLKRLPSKTEGHRAAPKPELVVPLARKTKPAAALKFIQRYLDPSLQAPAPSNLKPMLAGITDQPFNSTDWQFEIKWDGFRALSYLVDGKVDLRSRNNLSFNDKFHGITEALTAWDLDAVVDGEVVVLNENGHADFEALQNWSVSQSGTLVYFVFDLLWIAGYDLTSLPLVRRREILSQLIPANNIIRFSDSIDEAGIDFFKVAQQNGLEGIIAKRKAAPYISASRTKDWLKIKAEARHEAVICGYTKNRDTARLFSSLVLGIPGEDGLRFIGQVGTGFTGAMQKILFKKMNPLFTETCPFPARPATGAPTMWVQPQLICEVKYTELTKEGVMRHPSFQGLREDKSIADLNTAEFAAKEPKSSTATGRKKVYSKGARSTSVAKAPLLDLSKEEAHIRLNKQELKFTNLQKLYWQKEGIKKGDLLNYYHSIAEFILPYMKDRPQSLNRHPNGMDGENFYHKDMKGKVDGWLTTHRRFSDSVGEDKEFLVCTDEASLLYMANLGCIEMNPWHSRIQSPDNPDWCVIDLDPGTNTFDEVIETALVVKKVLDSYDITSYIKTSGSTGLHIYVPFGGKYTYDQSKSFAELVANVVHDELPLLTSLERSPAKRKDKIYLDYLQNRPIQTICAPYSCRPKRDATVSTPLHWHEVRKGLKMSQFTIHTLLERVKVEGDLFTGVLGEGIDLSKVLQHISQLA